MQNELTYLSIAALRKGLLAKTWSAREIADAHFTRMKTVDKKLNAYVCVTEEAAYETADRVDGKLANGTSLAPLAGIPVAYKDVFCTQDAPTTAASNILRGYTPPYDATSVAKLKAQDAVMLGKVNTDEFTMGSSTETSAFGPTKNPWDTTKVPGGSSGGSAAAVAAGLAPYSLATDTGGSIRQPAALCGVVGLKPTYGRISRYGVLSMASSLDTIGIIARSVADTAAVLQIIAGHDDYDTTTPPREVPDYTSAAETLRGARIGLPKEYFTHALSKDFTAHLEQVKKYLADLGAELVEVSLPHTAYAVAAYYLIAPSEISSNMARYDGMRFGLKAEKILSLLDTYSGVRAVGFGSEVKRRIMLGTYALSAGYYDAYYKKAQKVRTKIAEDFAHAFQHADVLLTPTTPTEAFALGEKTGDPLAMYLADIFTIPANLAGIPGISLPIGLVNGLPVGAQLLSPQFTESKLLAFAGALEQKLALKLRPDIRL